MNNLFVSVCMITYNHESYISEAIEGVLMQNVDFDFELIIADDCSTDKTEQVVQNFIDNHPKGNLIKYKRHERNLGMMPNFVWALRMCKGDYVALCEGDDFWTYPFKLKTQVDFLNRHKEFSMTFHDSIFFATESKKKFSEKYLFLNSKIVFGCEDLLFYKWFVPTASMVFRRFDPPLWLKNINSGDFSVQLILSKMGDFYYFPSCWSNYRIHPFGQGRVINTYKKRLNDIKFWWKYLPYLNRIVLARWYFSVWWRMNLRIKK